MTSDETAKSRRICDDGEDGGHESCEGDWTLSKDGQKKFVPLLEHADTAMEPNKESSGEPTKSTQEDEERDFLNKEDFIGEICLVVGKNCSGNMSWNDGCHGKTEN